VRLMLVRFYRFTRVLGLIFIFVFAVNVAILVIDGFRWESAGWAVLTVPFLLASVVATAKYRRSSRTADAKDVLFPLVRSEQEYCLLLRPFGRDGGIILPSTIWRFKGMTFLWRLNTTLEQVVASAVRTALGLATYGMVDQNVMFAPPGPKFVRASNHDWKRVAQELIQRAHSIILVLPPGRAVGDGLAWEVEKIVDNHIQARVLIVLPPCDQDARAHLEALREAGVLLALMEGSGRRADLNQMRAQEIADGLSTAALLVRWTKDSRHRQWVLKPHKKQGSPILWRLRVLAARGKTIVVGDETYNVLVGDTTYAGGIFAFLREIEFELSNWGFEERYPKEAVRRRSAGDALPEPSARGTRR
jgi:hypothetical protein